jgi:hypothetical protein
VKEQSDMPLQIIPPTKKPIKKKNDPNPLIIELFKKFTASI